MKSNCNIERILFSVVMLIWVTVLSSASSDAHCDGMDGPVVKAAQAALATGDANLVLIWVREEDEADIRRLFEQTIEVRKLSTQARDLADLYFFETLVRVHRAGEGASFTGLKPAGRDLGPAIPAADRALNSGDVAPLTDLLIERLRTGLLGHYNRAIAAKDFKPQDAKAGREYVASYVTFVHYVEGLYEAAIRTAEPHNPEGSIDSHQEH